jgi:hypothetical protein
MGCPSISKSENDGPWSLSLRRAHLLVRRSDRPHETDAMASISNSPSRGMRATSTNDLIARMSTALLSWSAGCKDTPRGFMLPKELLIDCVDCSEVIYILQKDLDDFVNGPGKDTSDQS